MNVQQLEFDFKTPHGNLDFQNQIRKKMSGMVDLDTKWYRINKYADWWCDRVPRCLGYGVYDLYISLRRWCISTYQKWRYGVSDEECWSLNTTFARYILPRLKHFRNMDRMGVPGNMFVKHHNVDETETDECAKRWNAILDEMIWTFEYIIDSEKFNPIPDTYNFLQNIQNDIRYESPEEKALWDSYIVKERQLNERMKNGLSLFAEHFDSLWD